MLLRKDVPGCALRTMYHYVYMRYVMSINMIGAPRRQYAFVSGLRFNLKREI